MLYKFLKRSNILNDFITEICRQKYDDDTVKKYKISHDVLDLLDYFDSICAAFLWDNTPQGRRYWADIERDFRIYLAVQNKYLDTIL